jgi:hypothetical protein
VDYLGSNSQYWGKSIAAGGAADPNFYMNNTNASAAISTFLIAITAYVGNETFGIYDKGNLNTLHPIFGPGAPGGNAVGGTYTITIPTNFGFYFDSSSNPNGGLFYSETSVGSPDGLQHFALFRGDNAPGSFFLGMEDLVSSGASDFDYNDMVVQFHPVPLPATLPLLGSGLVGLFAYGRRRRVV